MSDDAQPRRGTADEDGRKDRAVAGDARGSTGDATEVARRAASSRGGPETPSTRRGRNERKQRVLTRGTASAVRSIASAVVAKDGEPFFLCPPDGDFGVDGDHGFGLYYHDCRFLSGYELRLAGHALEPLAATAAGGTSADIELTNPAISLPDGGQLDKQSLTMRWTREVQGEATRLRDRITIRSFTDEHLHFPITLAFAARFDDVYLIRGLLDDHRGKLAAPRWKDGRLQFGYDGLDHVRRSLEVAIAPRPARRSGDAGVEFDISLPGRGETTIEVTLTMGERVGAGAEPIEQLSEPASRASRHAPLDRGRGAGGWVGGDGWTTELRSDSFLLDAVLQRSLDDLRLLRGRLADLAYYEAGLPWFATLFGRDAIITSLQTLAFDSSPARSTLRLLGAMQGTQVDDWRDEQPGKILHELRIGELARIGAIPHTPYYGTIDATPLFLILLERYVAWTGDMDLFDELRSSVHRALEWLDRWADSDGDGFIDYQSEQGHGLVNQGWKDSGDAIVDARGRIATPPIALAEVQGYAYRARLGIADLLERAGDDRGAGEQRHKAEELRERFEREFWSERLGTYILARQKDGKPCDVVTSNAGQVLWSGIASPEHARRTADRLLRDDMYDGWGIRTLSSEAVAYNPIGYHLGTVWPHDNGIIAAGLRRYGHDREALRLLTAILEAAADFPHFRLPECFAGYGRREFGLPVRYPVACHPQAWAAGSLPHLLTTVLGLRPDASAGRLRVVRPLLPESSDTLEVRGLRVGGGRADLRFTDTGRGVEVEVVSSKDLKVEVVDAPTGRATHGRAGAVAAWTGQRAAGLAHDVRTMTAGSRHEATSRTPPDAGAARRSKRGPAEDLVPTSRESDADGS